MINQPNKEKTKVVSRPSNEEIQEDEEGNLSVGAEKQEPSNEAQQGDNSATGKED